jgi:hypothetical protein
VTKRFLILALLGAAAAAFAIWFGMRVGSPRVSSSTVTALLPAETLALMHVPDVSDARAQLHQSDIYKLWREPALQEFLRKPLARNPQSGMASTTLQQLDKMKVRDAFIALVDAQENQPKLVGGFRFQGKPEDVERVVPTWRDHEAQSETVTYEQHRIEVTKQGSVTLARVYSGDWFFAANDLPALQAVLDRLDGRAKDSAGTLTAEENFLTAFKHMPRRYVAFAYGRVDRYFAKLAARAEQTEEARNNLEALRQMRTIAAATQIEAGKWRDLLYIGMPKAPDDTSLTRAALAMTTAESFLYSATATAVTAGGVPFDLPRLVARFGGNSINLEEWRNAFGSEVSTIGEWPADTRLPNLLVTVPVRDGAKAREIVRGLTIGNGAAETRWTLADKGGVQFCFQAPSSPMVPVAATIAVSDQLLVAGLDPGSVETAIARGGTQNRGVADAQLFKTSERMVPSAKSAFLYLDTALLYTRLDAAIRPMLIMAAAFMPSIAETVELGKLPAAEIVTRHLSPLVLSQAYQTDGYVTETIGPVSVYQAGVGIAIAAGFGTNYYQQQMASAAGGAPPSPSSPSPSSTSDE